MRSALPPTPRCLPSSARIQEETHRFSIDYQRRLRRESLSSELDQIPGVGEKRRNALLKAFRSIKGHPRGFV